MSPRQRDILSAHRGRLPDQAKVLPLLKRWQEGPGLPPDERRFLYLSYLAATSEPLFLALFRHPNQFRTVASQLHRPPPMDRDTMDEALARFLLSLRNLDTASALAAFRVYQTARILLQDVLGLLPFGQVTRELSTLADVLIQRAMNITYQEVRETLGLPQKRSRTGRFVPCELAVFALGKLGGQELNYASDVDLIFFYEEDGATDKGQTNASFFRQWIRDSLALLSRPTPYGACLRIDTTLRPRGRDGELALAFSPALAYYRDWSELWERQAWIKARLCAGSPTAGSVFLNAMAPVVYQPYPHHVVAGEILRMRRKTFDRLRASRTSGPELDLKEGRGGIREAEFAVQSLQLVYGAGDRWVREPHTLLAAAKLHQRGRLNEGQHAELARAYTLLRRSEHWAQVQALRQVHRLPDSIEDWGPAARFLGYQNPGALAEAIAGARADLRRVFQSVLRPLSSGGEKRDRLSNLLTEEGMFESLALAGVRDPKRAFPLLRDIYGALSMAVHTPEQRRNLLRIHGSLLREFKGSSRPYESLRTLHRLLPALTSEDGALERLLSHPRYARVLLRLVSQSEPVFQSVQQWPSLVHDLSFGNLGGDSFRLGAPEAAGTSPDGLRRWHKRVLFVIAARDLALGADVVESQAAHTALAEQVLETVFERVCYDLEREGGLPESAVSSKLCLLALGRLGTRRMQPRSDLDLVPVCSKEGLLPDDPERSAVLERRFVNQFTSRMTAVTRHGSLYAVDYRLRPHGASGPPVSREGAFENYFSWESAHWWERVSYFKARPVAGNRSLGARLLSAAWKETSARPPAKADFLALDGLMVRLSEKSRDMESDLKYQRGGLLNLDLIVRGLQARAGLPAGSSEEDLIPQLAGTGFLTETEASRLMAARRFQEALLYRLRLHFLRPAPSARTPGVVADLLARSGVDWLAPLLAASPYKIEGRDPFMGLLSALQGHRENVSACWRRLLE